MRSFLHTDLDLVRVAAADPYITLVSTVPAAFNQQTGKRYIERQRRRLRDGFGYSFVIAEETGDRGIGSIGVWLRDLDQGRASVGYWVIEPERGRGAARAALTAASRWALFDLGVPRLELHVEPWNTPSLRTAESAGFLCEGLLRSWQVVGEERRDMYMYALVAGDLLKEPGEPGVTP